MEERIGRLGISFAMRRRRILIYHDTLRALGEPRYVRFLLNQDQKRLAVQSCEYGVNGYHVVGDYKNEKWSYEINSQDLIRLLRNTCGWNNDCTYRVMGVSIPRHSLVEFCLDDAEAVVEDMDEVEEAGDKEKDTP